MAKKTNKTDHVLNLLSSGKKASAKEENDAPPVDLRRKAPEPPEEDALPEPSVSEELEDQQLPEPKMTSSFEEEQPEPKMTVQSEEDRLPEPRVSVASEEQLPEPRLATEPEKAPETKVTVEMAPKAPAVSVVHTANEENHIADAVRDSLEAEFNEYLREKGEIPAEPETERLIEWELPKAKEPTEINVFELMRESEEEAAAQEEQAKRTVETGEAPGTEPERTEPEPVQAEPEIEPEQGAVGPESKAEPAAASEPEPVVESVEPQEAVTAVSEQGPEDAIEAFETEPALEIGTEVSKPEPVAETATAVQEPESVEPEITTSAESVPEIKPEPEPAAPEEEPMEEKDYTMVNVMEYLVRDQVPRYIRQFGHCDCDRCIEDTVALTLTHLPAKYVVVNKNAVSPLLNFYEKKYAGQLIVEITKATMIVNESPNH